MVQFRSRHPGHGTVHCAPAQLGRQVQPWPGLLGGACRLLCTGSHASSQLAPVHPTAHVAHCEPVQNPRALSLKHTQDEM